MPTERAEVRGFKRFAYSAARPAVYFPGKFPAPTLQHEWHISAKVSLIINLFTYENTFVD
jgi:hypothetical protein